jgi:mitochondrial fission protein ELM1
MSAKTCWTLSDGNPGNENSCLGLAEAVGFEPEVKRIRPRAPWKWLPPALWFNALGAPGPDGDRLVPPWPDLLIACGRLSVAPSIAIRRAAAKACFTVQLLDPRMPAECFDLVAAPRHDRVSGENVIATLGALHRVTPERLAAAAARFAASIEHLPHPRVAVLIGGSSKRHRLTPETAAALGDSLKALGAGLMVTASRRTGEANERLLRARLEGAATVFWDGAGDNPYFGYLALADAIVVTGDSVAMISEACATGKPVHVYDLPGGSAKFERFHREMRDAGCTRPFRGVIETWTYRPPDETARVAAEIRRRMAIP